MTDRAAQQCHLPPRGFRGTYRADPDARAVYSEAAGIGRIVPAAVAVPVDADDVVTLVRWANERSLSLVPRGSGTSMAGGAIGPGVIVDLSRMNEIGEIDIERRTVRVGPGALRGDVNDRAGSRGLRFPVDPSSGRYCTIGGMVSTNAAGARTLRFGPTRDWIESLDCVFEDGSRAIIPRGKALKLLHSAESHQHIPAIQRFETLTRERFSSATLKTISHDGVRKDSSGYGLAAYAATGDLVDVIAGSEGTLAIIVGVELRLTEAAVATAGVLASFSTLDDAVLAATKARDAGAVACELLDRTFLEVASTGSSEIDALSEVPLETEAVLLAEVEGESIEHARRLATELADIFATAGATNARIAAGHSEQHEIWELRHAASPILARLDPRLKSMQFIEDSAVPSTLLADYVRGVREALNRRGVRGVIFGHAGDAHIHVNPLIDVGKTRWREDVSGLLEDIVTLTSRLKGTLAGEHGDGRLRAPLLPRVWSDDAVDLFRAVKNAFDPRGILNPGVKVARAGQQAIGDIKYDPMLAPLPENSRAVLDRVSGEKAYASSRLALLDEQV
ncbi:MAG TPA: FAD-binding oxidoreductase [Gemmatimonadaceae bacterium]|nr:FAD-binding oxidoreductase [Gemmatimonadaceae bacterium]